MADRPAACAYSLDGSTWILFPTGPRFDFGFGVEESNIVLETDRGRRFFYSQYTRDRWDLSFRFIDDDRASFQEFHDAVDGQLSPFYISIGMAGQAAALMYGRKSSGFFPAGISVAAIPVVYEYKFSVVGEIASSDELSLSAPFAGIPFGGLW